MRLRALLVAALLAVPGTQAAAEPVEIRADFGDRGQGWLFGSGHDGRCWIALPRHVLGADPAPFVFDDRRGRSGQSLAPITVAEVPGAVEAAAGQQDLAFAPVAAGARAPGECHSRLGLAPGMYRIVLPRLRQMDLGTLQGASTARFPVEITRATNDADEGATMLLRPVNAADNAYLVGGLSGSVASLLHDGQPHPGAMVLRANRADNTVLALRFDRIASAFALVEAHLAGGPAPSVTTEVGGQLAGVVGQLEPGAAPLERITAEGSCWHIRAVPGSRVVDIMLAVPEGSRVEYLRASLPEDCGTPSQALLDIRSAGGGWNMLSGACPVAADGAAACRVARTGPFELRLRLPATEGPAAIGAIRLE